MGEKRIGRPPRGTPLSTPIWCGQLDQKDRQYILDHTTPTERGRALLALAQQNVAAQDKTCVVHYAPSAV